MSGKDKFSFVHKKQLTRKQMQHYIKIYTGLEDLISKESYKEGNNKEQRMRALEDNIVKVIKTSARVNPFFILSPIYCNDLSINLNKQE